MEPLKAVENQTELVDQPVIVPAGEAVTARRVGILVLGMHRSGSSAMTRMLSLLGCTLPHTPMPVAFDNPRGHWESQPIADFNDEILGLAGTQWDDWLPLNPRLSETLIWPQLVARGREVLRQEFGDAPLFVLKDPRLCKLGSFWTEVLTAEAIEAAFVLPLRNPIEVARSLAKRDGIEEHHGLLIWLRHVLAAEAASRRRPRVVTDYAGLLDHWEELAVSLSSGLGLVWPRASALSDAEIGKFITPELRHHVSSTAELKKNPAISPWITKVYEVLLDWARHGENPADHAMLDLVRREFEDAGIAFARPMLSGGQAVARAAQADAERAALAAQRDTVALRLGEVEAELTQALVEQDARAAERDKLAGDSAVLVQERDTIAWRLGEIEAEVAKAKAERDALTAERDGLVRTHAELTEERNKVAWRLGEVEAEFSQARDQSAVLVEERNIAAWRLGEVEAERSEARVQSDYLRARVAELEDNQASTDGKIDTLEHSLAVTESTLRQREEEIAQLGTDLDASRLALATKTGATDAVPDDPKPRSLEIPSAEKPGSDSKAVGLAQLNELQRELADARAAWWLAEERAGVAEFQADAQSRQLADRFAELSELTKLLQQNERDMETSRAELGRAQAGLTNRFGELATVTQLYREQEQRADLQAAQADWLRQVHAVVSKTPYWWALVPGKWQRSRQLRLLQIKGLFDHHDYLTRYPDVAASGMDPLRHYILNGMIEGRAV